MFCCSKSDTEEEGLESKRSRKRLSKQPSYGSPQDIPSLREIYEYIKRDQQNSSYTKKLLSDDLVNIYNNAETNNGIGLNISVHINKINYNIKTPRAADKLSYTCFSQFFEPVIEESQGISLDAGLHSVIDEHCSSSFKTFNLNNPEIQYCEVSVVRNFDKFELVPILRDCEHSELLSELNEIKEKVFSKLTPTEEIPQEWLHKTKEISDILHNGFKVNLEPIQSISAYNSSSDGSITVGMLANYGDHLEIIASHKSGRIGDVFKELLTLCSNRCLKRDKFAMAGNYGFITFNPEDFGNGFNMKLKCRLPFCSRLPYAESVLKEYGLSIHNVEGEIVTLGNLYKLGMSEPETLQEFLKSFSYVFHRFERELMGECPKAVALDIMPVESLDRLVDMINKRYSRSFTKKYLSPNIVATMRGVTTKFGGRFAHCLRFTAHFPWSVYPRAPDPDAYTVYRRFFNQILLEHNRLDDFDHPRRPIYGEATEKDTIQHDFIKSYWISFVRNLKQFPFNMIISKCDRADVERKVCAVLSELPGQYVPISEIESVNIRSKHLIHSKSDHDKVQGLLRDWPYNRGVFVHGNNSEECEILVVVNHKDHIVVHGVDYSGRNMDKLYNKVTSIMRHLDNRLAGQFAIKPHLGFLSFCPFYVGTGMKIGANIVLKTLLDEFLKLEDACMRNNLLFQGTYGDGSPVINKELGIAFNIGLGFTEFETLKRFILRLGILIEREETLDEEMRLIIERRKITQASCVVEFEPTPESIETQETV